MRPGRINLLSEHVQGGRCLPALLRQVPRRRNPQNTARWSSCSWVFRGRNTQNTGNTEKRMNRERWGFVALAARCTGTSTWASVITLRFFEHGTLALEADTGARDLAGACALLVVALEAEGVIRRAGQGFELAPRELQEGPMHAHIATNAPRAASGPARGIQEGGRT